MADSLELRMPSESKENEMNLSSVREELNSCANGRCDTAAGGDENMDMSMLPKLDIDGLKDSAKSVASKAGDIAENVKDFTVDQVNTIKNIPMQDWKEVGKSGYAVASTHGPTLVVDTGLVVATEGTNVFADAKLGLDLYKTVTSPEAKDFGHDIAQAWKNGEAAKNAKA